MPHDHWWLSRHSALFHTAFFGTLVAALSFAKPLTSDMLVRSLLVASLVSSALFVLFLFFVFCSLFFCVVLAPLDTALSFQLADTLVKCDEAALTRECLSGEPTSGFMCVLPLRVGGRWLCGVSALSLWWRDALFMP